MPRARPALFARVRATQALRWPLLLWLGASGFVSCVVPSPPQYQGPQKTRPNINHALVDPPVSRILPISTNDRVHFNVPFQSEDAGENVVYQLRVNYALGDSVILTRGEVPSFSVVDKGNLGGSSGLPTREISFDWVVSPGKIADNCQQLTLIVTHRSNIDFTTDAPLDDTDVGQITWWANVNTTVDNQQTLSACPSFEAQ